MKTVQEVLSIIMKCLSCRHPNDTIARQQDAWWIIEAITGKTEAQIIAAKNFTITDEQHDRILRWLELHIDERMPLQYLIGWVPFGEVKIITRPPILIPRPETEEWTLKLIEQLRTVHRPLTILDLCAGTGCIAIALAKAFPVATVYATDINPAAIELIKENCENNQVANVHAVQSDLFTDLRQDLVFDLIVSNPPYIAQAEWASLDSSVTEWEDKRALVAGDTGLSIIEQIIAQAPRWTAPAQASMPQLVMEIDINQAAQVQKLYTAAGYHHVKVVKDLEGKDRTVWGSL